MTSVAHRLKEVGLIQGLRKRTAEVIVRGVEDVHGWEEHLTGAGIWERSAVPDQGPQSSSNLLASIPALLNVSIFC